MEAGLRGVRKEAVLGLRGVRKEAVRGRWGGTVLRGVIVKQKT